MADGYEGKVRKLKVKKKDFFGNILSLLVS